MNKMNEKYRGFVECIDKLQMFVILLASVAFYNIYTYISQACSIISWRAPHITLAPNLEEEEKEEEFLGLKPPNNEIKYIIKSIELFILMSSHSFNFMKPPLWRSPKTPLKMVDSL